MKVPLVSSRECVNALLKVGFQVTGQTGSHIQLRREDPFAKTVVPVRREIAKGTLRRILRDVNLSVDEFVGLL
ncbi:MAG: addiction module toxin, HicA family [Chloroflexi bacterium]|nr:addiction module toxin, HicA family [Chloroflexota bacterium]